MIELSHEVRLAALPKRGKKVVRLKDSIKDLYGEMWEIETQHTVDSVLLSRDDPEYSDRLIHTMYIDDAMMRRLSLIRTDSKNFAYIIKQALHVISKQVFPRDKEGAEGLGVAFVGNTDEENKIALSRIQEVRQHRANEKNRGILHCKEKRTKTRTRIKR